MEECITNYQAHTYLFSCESIIARIILATTFCSRGSKLYANSIRQNFKFSASTSF